MFIHYRCISEYIPIMFNHKLGKVYKNSIQLDKKRKKGEKIFKGGFKRITKFIEPTNELYDVDYLKDEINNIRNKDSHQRLGESLADVGKKQSWQLRLFNSDTKYSKYGKKCIDFIDNIANSLNKKAISISLAVMYPNTWLKYHEGFWGYGEYITRCMVGIECPKGCALHVCGDKPLEIKKGKMICFDDCKMHEAWNVSNYERIVIIFDLWSNEGFKCGKEGLNDIENKLNNRKINNEEDELRKKLSLETINIIRNQFI